MSCATDRRRHRRRLRTPGRADGRAQGRRQVSADGRPRLARQQRVGGDGVPEVFCADEQNDVAVDLDRWQQLALDVLFAEGVRGLAELAVLFVNEREMAELNDSYMGKPGPTDVLAFPIDAAEAEIVQHGQPPSRGPDRAPPDPADMPLLLGDVVICPAVAARAGARARRHRRRRVGAARGPRRAARARARPRRTGRDACDAGAANGNCSSSSSGTARRRSTFRQEHLNS